MFLSDFLQDLFRCHQFAVVSIQSDNLGMVGANSLNFMYHLPLVEFRHDHEIGFLQHLSQPFFRERPDSHRLEQPCNCGVSATGDSRAAQTVAKIGYSAESHCLLSGSPAISATERESLGP